MVILAEGRRQITFAQINELVPPKAEPADIECLIEALNARGIWIVDDE
jgi:hypothetical protein